MKKNFSTNSLKCILVVMALLLTIGAWAEAPAEKIRTTTLNLSEVTSNDESKLASEGWAWYYTATDKYAAKNLLLDNCKIEILENAASPYYGIFLPDGATVMFSPSSTNVINISKLDNSVYGLACLGKLTFGQNKGTGKLTVNIDKLNEKGCSGIIAIDEFTMNGDSITVNGEEVHNIIGLQSTKATLNGGMFCLNASDPVGYKQAQKCGFFVEDITINDGMGIINCNTPEASVRQAFYAEPKLGEDIIFTGKYNDTKCSWAGKATGISTTEANGLILTAGHGCITVTAQEVQTVRVVAVDGCTVRSINLNAGTQTVEGLTAGLYIVEGQKIVVR